MDTWDICVVSAASDAETAEKLAENIRRYRLPAGIVLPKKEIGYRKVVLDTEETAFDDQARKRLDESRFLVFLCSAEAKDSPELNQRLAYFRVTHDSEHVIAVIVKDEPEDAFPASFIERKMVQHILPDHRVIERMETIEPIAADLRADTPKRQKQLLRYETVRIIASVLYLHPDDLEQRQRTRQKKALISALALAAAVVVVISGIFIKLGLTARNEGQIATEQTRLTVETADRTMKELPEQFADEPLALDYIKEAIENARTSLAELGLEDLLDETESGDEP